MPAFVFIRHRVNRIVELDSVKKTWGVEIDVRSRNGKLILNHETHAAGDPLVDFVTAFKRRGIAGPLIVNTKEDGHEDAILALLARKRISNFFFLDTTLPTMVRLFVKRRIPNVAVRVSEYEPLEFARHFKNRVAWAWLDCFSGVPPALAQVKKLRRDFRVCLVSPELQGYAPSRIAAFLPLAPHIDAVCSKYPDLWSAS
jgi:hypothetical protein